MALFTAAPAPAGYNAPAKTNVIRSRFVRIDLELLGAAKGQGLLEGSPALWLEPFEGTSFTALPERVFSRAPGKLIWHGYVKGLPGSAVTFAVHEEAVAGTIHVGDELYEVLHAGKGQHVVRQLPLCQPMPEAPERSAPPTKESGVRMEADLADSGDVIDVMVVYTPASRVRYGSSGIVALIELAIAETNQAYVNSQISTQLNLVHTAEVDYVESGTIGTDLDRLTYTDGYMDEVHTWRNTYGADQVTLIEEDDSYCGIGWVMQTEYAGFQAYAFTVVDSDCATGYYSYGHELGHNQGMQHDRANAGFEGARPYAYGYWGPSYAWRTIMAYNCPVSCTRIQYFSNPDVLYGGQPTGIDHEVDPVNSADNARTLNETKVTFANFRQSVSSPPAAPTGLSATAVSHTQIDLAWTDNANNETGFRIERSPDGSTNWSQIDTVGANVTSYSDTDLEASTWYYYRVRAYSGAGDSDYSNVDGAQTEDPPSWIDQVANGEIPVAGTVTGSYIHTQANEGTAQSIREVETNTNPQKDRYSYLQHKWTFSVRAGVTVTFLANAWAPPSLDGDSFVLAYSTDDAEYTGMFTVLASSDDDYYQSYDLPAGITGTVYVRAMDTDRTAGNRDLDTLYVDHLYIRTDRPATAVTLSYFRATRSGQDVHFEWQTSNEVAHVGFNLYVESREGWRRINEALIPAQAGDSMAPRDYFFHATGLAGNTFGIEDLDVMGQALRHGPFKLGKPYGERLEVDPVAWSPIGEEWKRGREMRNRARSAGIQALVDGLIGGAGPDDSESAAPAESGVPPSTLVTPGMSFGLFDLLVEEDGLYRVTYEAMRDAGIDLQGVKPAWLALTNRGESVPIYVQSQTKFGAGGYIEFYGQALDTLYTKANVYTLHVDASRAERAGIDRKSPKKNVAPVPYYMETLTVEQNEMYRMISPSGDPWYETEFTAWGGPTSASFEVNVDHYAGGGEAEGVSVHVWGVQSWGHHVTVDLNGSEVANEEFTGITDVPIQVDDLGAGSLHEGSNTLTVRLPFDLGERWDTIAVESYGVTYPRALMARDGRLTFEAAGEVFRVEGLPTPNVVVYRMTGNELVLLDKVEVEGGEGAYQATFAGSEGVATYAVSTVEALLSATVEAARLEEDITSGAAQYLVISHPHFIDGLAPLVGARKAQGLTVRVVDVEQVYLQFGHSIVDPQAIQDYIGYAAGNMGTEYVLLVGGDTYDYHDYLSKGSISFVPSLYAPAHAPLRFVPVDPLFTDVDGDNLPDLAIGRFPARTLGELALLIGKTLDYAQKDYGQTAVMAADVYDAAKGLDFAGDSEAFRAKLVDGWAVRTAYVDDVGLDKVDEARQVLQEEINDGVALTTYVGHSGEPVWGNSGLFNVAHADALSNAGRPTVVVQFGCWSMWYTAAHSDPLGIRFLVSGDRGAAAALGSVALAEAVSQRLLGELLMPRLTQPGMSVGAAMQAAKAELAITRPHLRDVLLGWTLLGDPALVVQP